MTYAAVERGPLAALVGRMLFQNPIDLRRLYGYTCAERKVSSSVRLLRRQRHQMQAAVPADQAAILAEYSALMQRVADSEELQAQVAVVALPLAGAVLAYAYFNSDSLAVLAVIVVLAAALWYSVSIVEDILRVTSYISAVIEPKVPGLQWETMLVKLRSKWKTNSFRRDNLSVVFVYWVASVLCLPLAWYFARNQSITSIEMHGVFALAALLVLAAATTRIFQVTSRTYYASLEATWRDTEFEVLSDQARRRDSDAPTLPSHTPS